MTTVEFYFDPACPWCWITARWLVDVQSSRDLHVVWKTFSLQTKNAGTDVPEKFARGHRVGHRTLRVIEAVRADHGDGPVIDLYTEFGSKIHHDRDLEFDMADAVAAAGVDPSYAAAAEDDRWDAVIDASMKSALDLVGEDVGVPIIVFGDGEERTGFFGPVLSPAPTGSEAVELFDHLEAMASMSGFWELKRTRTVGPEFGQRP